ncbi:cation-independent mannose-6-phosphate receptor isoform X2 [Chelonus insularis]|uniref:cation-independent mannose-6-phosphate receptor isoform X2 n=1 Tax=Chelonus insularis TaxID=460826 RepID=UPI00158B8081|nr:cation-independent mannose-6-phosphate receptor isoform X2 [Chelonus insularis]
MWYSKTFSSSATIFICLHFCYSKESSSKEIPRIDEHDPCLYVNNQIGGIDFDFTNLSNVEHVIRLKNSKEKISLQLCKEPLKNLCNNRHAYVCFHRGNKEIVLGNKPQYNDIDGKMTFNYIGESCKNDKPYTLNIVMICDFKKTNSEPEIHFHSDDQCAIEMIWRTISACGVPPMEKPFIDCTVTDDAGNFYDLSSLTKYSDNYIVPIDENTSIILNVCHPIVYGNGAVCRYSSSVCLRHSLNMSYVNLGDVSSPTINKNKIQLNNTNGNLCRGQAAFTLISFICDEESGDNTIELTGVERNCRYNLLWKTNVVCRKKPRFKMEDKCIAFDPVTKMKYDLKSLMIKDQILESSGGIHYKLRVCAPLLNNSCQSDVLKADAGVCSAQNLIIGGKANSNFFWSAHGPYLNYTDGSPCGNQNRRYTLIHFSCERDKSKNVPTIVEDKACHLIIQWNTSLVCNDKSIKYLLPEEQTEIPKTKFSELDRNKKKIINESISSTSTIPLESSKAPDIIDESNETVYVSVVTISVLLAICGSFVVLYLLNSRVRGCINSSCCSRWFKKSNIRMQYSKVVTLREDNGSLYNLNKLA